MKNKPTYEELERRVKLIEEEIGAPDLSEDAHGSEAYYRRLIEAAGDIVYTITDDGICTYISPNCEMAVGYGPDAVIGQEFMPFVHKDDRERVSRIMAESLREYCRSGGKDLGQRICEYRVRLGWGGWKWIAAKNAILEVKNGKYELVCIARDITEQKKYEDALKESEEKYRFLIEESNDVIWTFDLDTKRFSFSSNVSERLLGYSKSNSKSITIDDLFSPETKKKILARFGEILKGENPSNRRIVFEAEHRRSDGTWIWMEVSAVMHRDKNGRPVSLTGVSRDISKRKQAEEEQKKRSLQLRQLAQELSNAEDKERKRIALILHDDLQQYLAAIRFNLHVLPMSADSSELHSRIKHLEGLIDESIRKCRVLSYDLSPPILHQYGFLSALEWLSEDMKDKYGLRVILQTTREADPASPALASMLYRTVRELLFNAAKHSGADSAIVKVYLEDGCICIKVKDEGRGCDPEAMKKKKEIAGFGLFTIEERISFLGGSMEVESAPGKGCCVTLCLPAQADGSGCTPAFLAGG